MRVQTAQMVALGYGKYVRSDEVVAIEPITDSRGPGRRSLVWVRGIADPFVSSRSESAILADLMRPAESLRTAAGAGEPATRGRAQKTARPAAPRVTQQASRRRRDRDSQRRRR